MLRDRALDDLILVRTERGRGLTADECCLDKPQGRLLRMVNGYTSLANLTARLDPDQDWCACADTLLHQRLVRIEPAVAEPATRYLAGSPHAEVFDP